MNRYNLTINSDSEEDIKKHLKAYDTITAVKALVDTIVKAPGEAISKEWLLVRISSIMDKAGIGDLL
jgi:hypothetical protein